MSVRNTRIKLALAALLAGALALPGLAAADRGRGWGDGPRGEAQSDRGRGGGYRDEAQYDRGRGGGYRGAGYGARGWRDGGPRHRGYGRGYGPGWGHRDGHRGGRDVVVVERPVYRRPYIPAPPGLSVILNGRW